MNKTKQNKKIARTIFWIFLVVSLAALLLGIFIKWLNIDTSHISSWTISNMFSPLKENSWSLSSAFPYKWLGSSWVVIDQWWFDGSNINPTNFVYNIAANYAILIVATTAMGVALIALIVSFFTKNNRDQHVIHEMKGENNNPNPIQVIFNAQPNFNQTEKTKAINNSEIKKVPEMIVIPEPETKAINNNYQHEYDYLAKLEAKYATELKQQEAKERLEQVKHEEALRNAVQDAEREKILKMFEERMLKKSQMSVQERAKIDGSASILEPRSELQKHANQMRSLVGPNHKSMQNADLRGMTKKELIKYMRNIANVLNK
ncbi:hypothetical protein [Williamsoniiplasma lucivorax]|uniref:Uncharacterized protein n=1 Tax=Williamsoniiplasma lucivorax TaxID=209274 RepID=A0A2S5RF31_9MOLU|nr:hypothetical protein [Williamsoniiplasma lucivorax]PPE05822.1 hypothetical protein ELUCI_v1c01100 [Williamsoniiplasma lucivorax]